MGDKDDISKDAFEENVSKIRLIIGRKRKRLKNKIKRENREKIERINEEQ